MNHWAFRLRRVLQNETCVLVTVGPIRGSAPRSPGARMIVSRDRCRGSIGGGNLEFTAIGRARELINNPPAGGYELEMFGLGPALNQCCGGSVQVLFEFLSGQTPAWLDHYIECLEQGTDAVLITALADEIDRHLLAQDHPPGESLPAEVALAATELLSSAGHVAFHDHYWLESVQQPKLKLFLFGAGHVGKALVSVMEPLPFDITWVDSREHEFPDRVPGSIMKHVSVDPLTVAVAAKPGSLYLVMTHSHELDEDLCHAILQREDFAWLGLIGSTSKRRRFVSRLAKRGITDELLDRLICPIGITGIRGKQPATIAVAVAAQLLAEFHQAGEQ